MRRALPMMIHAQIAADHLEPKPAAIALVDGKGRLRVAIHHDDLAAARGAGDRPLSASGALFARRFGAMLRDPTTGVVGLAALRCPPGEALTLDVSAANWRFVALNDEDPVALLRAAAVVLPVTKSVLALSEPLVDRDLRMAIVNLARPDTVSSAQFSFYVRASDMSTAVGAVPVEMTHYSRFARRFYGERLGSRPSRVDEGTFVVLDVDRLRKQLLADPAPAETFSMLYAVTRLTDSVRDREAEGADRRTAHLERQLERNVREVAIGRAPVRQRGIER
jgi:hypothetical protein